MNGTLTFGLVCRDGPYFKDEFDIERMVLLKVLKPNILQVDLRHFLSQTFRPFSGADTFGKPS